MQIVHNFRKAAKRWSNKCPVFMTKLGEYRVPKAHWDYMQLSGRSLVREHYSDDDVGTQAHHKEVLRYRRELHGSKEPGRPARDNSAVARECERLCQLVLDGNYAAVVTRSRSVTKWAERQLRRDKGE